MEDQITRRLASFAVRSCPADLPARVRKEAARALVNWIGNPIAACRHETTECVLDAFGEFSGPREASVLGRSEKLDIFTAALVNCVASGVFDYDDTHIATVIHPTGPIASSLLALSERKPMRGEDFLHALVLGIEVQCRLANALATPPAHCDPAWFLTGLTGGIGTAIAVGRILGLNEQQMIWAIGIAAMRAAGPRETHGTMAKNLVPAWAAQAGMHGALLAQRGFTTSDTPIEGPRGLGYLYTTQSHWPALVDGLGERWELMQNTYKPFPSGIVMHPALTGALEIAVRHRPEPDAIERVDLSVHPMCMRLTGRRTPLNAVEGTFSVYHWVAVALREREIRIRQFSDACVGDPRNVALRDRVHAQASDRLRVDEAHVRVTMRDGRVLEQHVEHQLGAVERPMSDAELEAKLHDLADPTLGAACVDDLARACWDIGQSTDASTLVRLCLPQPRVATLGCNPGLAPGRVRFVPGVAALAADFDGFILDQWGVLHDGAKPYPGAIDCLRRLREAGKHVVVLSNSGRRDAYNVRLLTQLGFAASLYDRFIGAGEDARAAIVERRSDFHRSLGARCYAFTRDGDHSLLDGIGLTFVETVADADFLAAIGIDSPQRNVVDYEPELRAAIARQLPLICANPDLVRPSPQGPVEAPGMLAQRYEELGGRVVRHGKPYPEIYRSCLDALGACKPERVVAIGDSIEHDIFGAARAGLASAFVAGGIHADELVGRWGDLQSDDRWSRFIADAPAQPDFVLPTFAW